MGDAAADHHRVGLAIELEIVGVGAFSAHQDRILATRHRLSDAELHQREGLRIVLQIHQPMP
jgi:hypothetical protein